MSDRHAKFVLESNHFQQLLDALARRDYRVVGPTVRDGAIVYDTVRSIADLPVGWTDEQNGGTYRLRRRNDQALFGYAVGPHSWKKFLHPPAIRLWQATHQGNRFEIRQRLLNTVGSPFSAFVPASCTRLLSKTGYSFTDRR
jgi:sulfhydrogenase subunit beta (sulfur reductase)